MSSVDACSIESLLGALERAGAASADPATALGDAVDALWAIAEASGEPGGASLRVDLKHRGKHILVRIIRRGVASGAFRPVCTSLAERGLVHALVAGACARWVFGLPEERSLRARPAADAALAVLRPTWRQGRRE